MLDVCGILIEPLEPVGSTGVKVNKEVLGVDDTPTLRAN